MKVLVTGGCGFIGTNVVIRHLDKGDEVVIVDNLSRVGSKENLARLVNKYGAKFTFYREDVESPTIYDRLIHHKDIDIVYHMAAQVAVTTSVKSPIFDCVQNVLGTLNILEVTRKYFPKAFFIYASTNKVYGESCGNDPVSETNTFDCHSPYGCSKGAADMYVRDYARVYGIDTVVFRQSCIYGEYQTGIEDQGWLSWFCQKFIKGEPIKIYGDGKQVRDALYIEDLLNLYDTAYDLREKTKGQVYNVGGGPENTVSLLELISMLGEIHGSVVNLEFNEARAGDQKVYISDILKSVELGWNPVVSIKEGLKRLYAWTKDNL